MATNTTNATDAFTGWGGAFSVSVDGGQNFTEVTGIRKYGPSGSTMPVADRTHLKSPNARKQKLAGGPTDEGTVTLDIVANPSDPGQILLAAARAARQAITCKVEYPPLYGMTTGVVQTYGAWITKHGFPDMSFDVATYSVELEIDGAINETPGA